MAIEASLSPHLSKNLKINIFIWQYDKSDIKYSDLPFKTSIMGSYSQYFPVKVALKAFTIKTLIIIFYLKLQLIVPVATCGDWR